MANSKHPSAKLTQLFPEKKQVLLEGLYLAQGLTSLSKRIGRPLIIASYITDLNGLVATRGVNGRWQVPPEIKNPCDWRLFQELLAQADLAISGSSYIKRFISNGSHPQDILFQFQPGMEFEALGEWRLGMGFKKRSPDLAFLTHQLDFSIPEILLNSDREIFIFTTSAMAETDNARVLRGQGVHVIGSGERGVEIEKMVSSLQDGFGFRVMMLVTGPSVLDLLLGSNELDLLYVTQVQLEIPFENPSSVCTMLPPGTKLSQLEGFQLKHQFIQEDVTTDAGLHSSQFFLRYDRQGIHELY
jgi:riboflavin biosynthesis pyrimidine reductase